MKYFKFLEHNLALFSPSALYDP